MFAEIGTQELEASVGRPGRLIRISKVNLESGFLTEITGDVFYNLYSVDFYIRDDRYLVSAFEAALPDQTGLNWKNNAYVFHTGLPFPAVTFEAGNLTRVATDRSASNIAFVAMVNKIDNRRGNYSYDVFRYDAREKRTTRVTYLNTFIHSIALSPDGRSIAFAHNKKAQQYDGEIVLITADGVAKTIRR